MIKKIFAAAFTVLTASLLFQTASYAQTKPDTTIMYAQRDTCNLYLDIYEPEGSKAYISEGIDKPTIIFMFGGGFIHGTRDNESYNKWFKKNLK